MYRVWARGVVFHQPPRLISLSQSPIPACSISSINVSLNGFLVGVSLRSSSCPTRSGNTGSMSS